MLTRSPRPQHNLSAESLRALDGLNASLAALLMGFGPFLSGCLADRGWMPANIGLVLTASALTGLLIQAPAGDLIDMAKSKRALVATATAALMFAALIFGVRFGLPLGLRGGCRTRHGRNRPRAGDRRHQSGVGRARCAR